MKVFLGGTCNNSTWRDELIKMLSPNVEYFNPVVDDWTPECQEEEIRQRATCDVVLYVVTPAMKSVYSIAEVVDDSNKRPTKTVFAMLHHDGQLHFGPGQWKSLAAVAKMVIANGALAFRHLESVANHLNAMSARTKTA